MFNLNLSLKRLGIKNCKLKIAIMLKVWTRKKTAA